MTLELEPETFEEAASQLAAASAERSTVRIRGAGTKLGWGRVTDEPDVELRSSGLDRILEHNAGDLTAVLQAGVPLARAQEKFADSAQMLALDPPLGRGSDDGATIGGVIAAGDSGPLRHRYGGGRDLVVGMTAALSDGTITRSGGKVIKNVAGYDVAKLLAGAFGTLGMILSVSVRLHPLPPATITVLGASESPELLTGAAQALMVAPLELEALDVAWRGGRGGLLARTGGAEASRRAERVALAMREAELQDVDIADEDEHLWARQRAGQRSNGGALVRVATAPSALPEVLRAADACVGTVVGRAALGTSFVELAPESVGQLREALAASASCVVLDAPAALRQTVDPWGTREGPALELMRSVKRRFDPGRTCNPGVFVGGI